MATLAVSLLFAALLIACGGESPEPAPGATGDTRTAAGDAVPTIIPTEVPTTVPTEQPARGDTGRNRERRPVSETSPRASIRPTRASEPTPVRGITDRTDGIARTNGTARAYGTANTYSTSANGPLLPRRPWISATGRRA